MLRTFLITILLAAAPLLPAQEERPLSCDDAKLEEALASLKKEATEEESPRAARQVYMRYDFAGHRPQAEAWAQKFISLLTEKSSEGNSKAMMNLAYIYLQGDALIPADREKAMLWLQSAKAAENAQACIVLAHLYNTEQKQEEAAKEYRHAFAIYEKRAADGDVDAKLKMADMLFTGLGIQGDPDRAVTIYKELAEQDNRTALTELFRIYSKHSKSEKGMRKAMEYARRLADMGDAKMAYLVYCELMRGQFAEKDEATAAQYLQAAIKEPSPYPEALYQMGWDAEMDKRPADAEPYYERAITMGHDRARTRLGRLLVLGMLGEDGKDRGLKMLEESALQHNSPYSAYELALHYDKAGDSAQADEWYIKSSDRGFVPAMARRGLLHLNPFSPVEWSPTLAYRWWKQGERAEDPKCSRYINTYLYVFIPLLVVIACSAPLLLLKALAKRKKKLNAPQ